MLAVVFLFYYRNNQNRKTGYPKNILLIFFSFFKQRLFSFARVLKNLNGFQPVTPAKHH